MVLELIYLAIQLSDSLFLSLSLSYDYKLIVIFIVIYIIENIKVMIPNSAVLPHPLSYLKDTAVCWPINTQGFQ